MPLYLIDPRANGGDQFTLEAADHGKASDEAAKRIHGPRAGSLVVYRTTGDTHGSGMFQAYHRMHSAQPLETSVGNPFHVMEL